jgi:Ca2+-binding RTX toxin-like protein
MATINGTAGDDVLAGTVGDDIINGGRGNDDLSDGDSRAGGAGSNDVLNGGFGDDRLTSSGGNDTLTGGGGHDIFEMWMGSGDSRTVHVTDFDPANDTLAFNYSHWDGALVTTATDQGVLFQYDRDGDGRFDVSVAVDTAEPVAMVDGRPDLSDWQIWGTGP